MITPIRSRIQRQVSKLNVWKRRGERAPHKPLLMLLALGRIAQGQPRLASFKEVDGPLARLLREYGPPRQSVHPEYPFWRLQNDGLWEVPNGSTLTRRASNTDPPKSQLIKNNVVGGFPEAVFDIFRSDREFLENTAATLLEGHFPTSMHEDLLNAVGLALKSEGRKTERDPAFRQSVIQAYEHRCAICGYDGKLGLSDLALEAAHIKWHQAGGPGIIDNGLALCAIHHKAFDRGALGVTENFIIIVSADLHGQSWVTEWFYSFKGKQLRPPHSRSLQPSEEYLRWHREQVFRPPPRD